VIGGGDIPLDLIRAALAVHSVKSQEPSSDPASRGHLLPQAGEGVAPRRTYTPKKA
jgi:hypothetical protein